MNKLNRTLFRTRAICAALTFASGTIALNGVAQTNAPAETPRVVLAQTNHIKATVEDIDYAKREVTLKGPQGNLVQVAVDESVKNFPQMKKGDHVNIGYYESVAFAIAKPGEKLAATSHVQALATRKEGEKPGGTALSVTDTTATVEDVDREKREVTLKGIDGNIVTVVVDPSVGNLQRIKKGDQITATRTEALAISVDAPDAEQK